MLPPNLHLLPLYSCDATMFESDGRHFKQAYGKDYLDHLIGGSEQGMRQLHEDMDDRWAREANRATAIQGRVDLLRRDHVRTEQRINVVVARAAEEADALMNERLVLFCRLVFWFSRLSFKCSFFLNFLIFVTFVIVV